MLLALRDRVSALRRLADTDGVDSSLVLSELQALQSAVMSADAGVDATLSATSAGQGRTLTGNNEDDESVPEEPTPADRDEDDDSDAAADRAGGSDQRGGGSGAEEDEAEWHRQLAELEQAAAE